MSRFWESPPLAGIANSMRPIERHSMPTFQEILSAPIDKGLVVHKSRLPAIPPVSNRCRLLELPRELRNIIYEFLFEHTMENLLSTNICIASARPSKRFLGEAQDLPGCGKRNRDRWPSKLDVPLPQTCKTIRAEAGPYHSSRMTFYLLVRGEEHFDLAARIAEHSATWHEHLPRALAITLQVDLDEDERHVTREAYLATLVANLNTVLSYLNRSGIVRNIQRIFLSEGYFASRWPVPTREAILSDEVMSKLSKFEFQEGTDVYVHPMLSSGPHDPLGKWLETFGGRLNVVEHDV